MNCGDWYGNDTIWRTIADINYILIYSNKLGKIQQKPQRKQFNLVDGIICGEKNGPILPQLKKCGILLGGENPLITDILASHCMGFDWNKIPSLYNIFNSGFIYKTLLSDKLPPSIPYRFVPPDGWENYIEY